MITLLSGIPASGKSTYANRLWRSNPTKYIVISRDKIRELLFGYRENEISEYYDRQDTYKLEKLVSEYQHELILSSLSRGKNVIIDNTNVKLKTILGFKKYRCPIKLVVVNTPLDVCIERDNLRTRVAGEKVIRKKHNQFRTLMSQLEIESDIQFTVMDIDVETIKPKQQHSNKWNAIIVDVDGTLAIKGDRSPYDWNRVHEDKPNERIIDIVISLSLKYDIIICTGRDEVAEEQTIEWLDDYNIPYKDIYIRKDGDSRPDFIVKGEMWKLIEKNNNIVAMIDDRRQVIDHARSLGYTVLDVASNHF